MGTAFVFNTRTGALSRYENLDGIEVASMLGTIFLLGPKTAVASPTLHADSYVTTGQTDLGSLELKNVRSAYVGAAIDTPPEIAVTADGQTYTYQVMTAHDSILREHRALFGRGLRARFWAVKILCAGKTLLRDFSLLPHVKERKI